MTIQIQGRVLNARSKSGIGKVQVSNGEVIVQTDADGQYTMQVSPQQHRFVFVTVPDGFSPNGMFFQPTTEWAVSRDDVDFELAPAPERAHKTFSLAHISDTHVVAEEGRLTQSTQLAQDLGQLMEAATPDFIVASGDLTNRGKLSELNRYREAIQTVDVPVFSLFGGHDGNEERYAGEAGMSFIRNYEQTLGPTYYSFDWGGRHFVLYPAEDHFFSADDRQRKEHWLWQDLTLQPEDKEIIVVLHTPPSTAFLEQLARYNVSLVLYGHWHSSKVFSYRSVLVAATQSFCFGGIDTTPRGYRLVTFGDDGIRMKLGALSESDASPSDVIKSAKIHSVDFCTPATLDNRDVLRLCWQQRLETGFHRAAPVCSEGNLLLSLWDEGHSARQGILCLDVETKRSRWRVVTDASIKNSVAAADGRCVAVSITGRVYVVEIASGKLLWQADLPGYPERWVYTSPAISDGVIYAGARSGYGAFDLETGEQRWYAKIESTDAWSSYASSQIYENLVLLLISRRGLLALDRDTGALAWEQKMGVEYQYPSPVLAGDVLVSGGDSGCLAVLRADSGEIVWHKPVLSANYATGLTVNLNRIYITTANGEARCYELQSGELHWRFRSGFDLLDMTPYRRSVNSILAHPVVFQDKLIVCGCDGYLYVLDASGELLGKIFFGSPISASPHALDSRLYVGTYDGELYCFGG